MPYGVSPEPNLLSLYSPSWKKAYIDPNRFWTSTRSRKVRLVMFASRKTVPVFSAIPNPKNYVESLVFYGPWGVAIGRNVTGWHCRRTSTLSIGGARTRTFFGSVKCYLLRWSLRRYSRWRMRLIWQSYQNDCRICKLFCKITVDCRGITAMVREIWRFP